MFHLSLPVERFDDCLGFYRTCFDAEVVDHAPGVANLFVFGGQVTLHDRPGSPLTGAAREQLHFGVVLPIATWTSSRDRLRSLAVPFVRLAELGEPGSRGKMLVRDPSGNLVEINSEPLAATGG